MSATIAAALGRACGGRVRVVREVSTLGESCVWEALLDDRRVVVKDQPTSWWVDLEAWGLRKLTQHGMRVPEVIAVDTTGDLHPRPLLIVEWIEGVSLSEVGVEAQGTVASVGEQLRTVHEVAVEGFGLLNGKDDNTFGQGGASSWSAAMRVHATWAVGGLVRLGVFDARRVQRFWDLFESHVSGFDGSAPCLLHGDLQAAHVLVDPMTGVVAGVIDPLPRSGEPAFDLVQLVVTGGEHLQEPLLRGYGCEDVVGERWDFYALVATIAFLSWNLERGGEAGPWLARLRAAARRVGMDLSAP